MPVEMDRTMEKRATARVDKVFPVWITSAEFGECQAIARNISAGGILIEMSEPLPLGCAVRVHFSMPDSHDELVARGEVKRHYFLQFADETGPRCLTGMGIRFTGFEDPRAQAALGERLTGMRTLH